MLSRGSDSNGSLLALAREEWPAIVTEVMSEDDVLYGAEYADILQIGSRNMENYSRLKRLPAPAGPFCLKRGMVA
jgi:3-deoxy-7-phosphoheptulonate synthase